MSFSMVGLGPADQAIIRLLSPAILNTLRGAAETVKRGGGGAESSKWFGDNSRLWLGQLAGSLNRMASIVNLEEIRIGFTSLGERSTSFAAALQPTGGWGDYSQLSRARGRSFQIELDVSWNKAPLFRPNNQPGDSMFQTLVHELSHLVLGTDDYEYGVADCLQLAHDNPLNARRNADSWGYFIEEFRQT
jgi:hypothetical protein